MVTLCSFTAAAEQETCLLLMGLVLVLFFRAFVFESILDLLHSETEGTEMRISFLFPAQPSFISVWDWSIPWVTVDEPTYFSPQSPCFTLSFTFGAVYSFNWVNIYIYNGWLLPPWGHAA